jgi:hypothetical protein
MCEKETLKAVPFLTQVKYSWSLSLYLIYVVYLAANILHAVRFADAFTKAKRYTSPIICRLYWIRLRSLFGIIALSN